MLADLEALQAREVASVPLTYFELERNLGMFGTLLGTVLGNQHIISVTYGQFWDLLNRGFCNELQQIIDLKGYVKPAHILRSIHLACYSWFTQRRHHLAPPTPDFVSILHNITLNTYILPRLPPQLYKLAYPKLVPPNTQLSLNTPTMGALTDTSSIVSALTSATAVRSTLTGPTVTSSRQKGAWIANLAPEPTLQNIVPAHIKLKDLIAKDPPPTLDNGAQVCLSHLVHQGCWSTCKSANTHAHMLTSSEKSRVLQYLLDQVHKYNVTTQGAQPHATLRAHSSGPLQDSRLDMVARNGWQGTPTFQSPP
jgi:hypothetical protein